MSNGEIEFLIESGTKKQVEKTKTIPAWMFFSLGNFKPKNGIYSATVDGFTAQFRNNGPCDYVGEKSNMLCISRFGYFGGKGDGPQVMIDRALANNDEATIRKAFTKLALKMLQGGKIIPPTAINLFDPDCDAPQEYLPKKPAWFEIHPESTITKTKEVQELDDIYFDVEHAIVPDDEPIEVGVDGLKISIFDHSDPRYVSYLRELRINHLGWFSESPGSTFDFENSITKMRAVHSNETIEKAFRLLGEKLLERVKKDSSKKRKAPPANPRVWTLGTVDDEEKAESGKRVKRTPRKAKSD